MKTFMVLAAFLFVGPFVGPLTWAQGNTPTITVAQSTDPTFLTNLNAQLTRAQQFKRSKCATGTKTTGATSQPLKNATGETKRFTCADIDDLIEELGIAVSDAKSSSTGGNSSACQAAYTSYTTAKTEASKACSKVGGCTSEKFETCRDHMETYSGEFEDGEGLDEYLSACPFFAATKAKQKGEEVEELDKALEKIVTDIKDLEEKAKTTKKESEERMVKLKEEITEGQSDAQASLDGLQSTIQKMRSSNSEKQGAMVSAVRAIQQKMTELNTVEFGRVRNEYTKQVLEVEQQCYVAGINAAAAEATRLKGKKGIAMDELGQQMAAGSAVGYLRTVANAAYQQCLGQGPFAKTSKAADDTYQERVKLLESQYNSMDQEIASLKKSYGQMIQDQPKEEQQVQMQVFTEAQNKAKAVAAKEQEYSNLASQLRQSQMEIQNEIGQLATKRYKADSDLRKARSQKTTADSKSTGSEVKDEDFSFAIGAFDASEDSRNSARAICKCSTQTADNLCGDLSKGAGSSSSSTGATTER